MYVAVYNDEDGVMVRKDNSRNVSKRTRSKDNRSRLSCSSPHSVNSTTLWSGS